MWKTLAKAFRTSRSEIIRRVKAGTLPRPFKLGRKLLWRESRIRELINKLEEKAGAI